MANFEKSQKIVGINEGGYQDDPRDTGNYYMGNLIGTNWGISAATLGGFLGRIPSKAEMVNLSRNTAEQILKANYWTKNNFDALQNQSVATLIYDGAVHHGTNEMRFLMEKALNILKRPMSYYEVFTAQGIKLLNRLNQKELFSIIKSVRTEKYKQSSKKQYINGWLNRLARIKYYADNSFGGIWPYTAMLVAGIGILLIVF